MTGVSVRCPACDRDVRLRKDASMRHHQAWLAHGPGSSNTVQFPPLCIGVGKTVEQCRQAMVNTEVAW